VKSNSKYVPGYRQGLLTIIGPAEPRIFIKKERIVSSRQFLWKCACGNTRVSIPNSEVKSCGCLLSRPRLRRSKPGYTALKVLVKELQNKGKIRGIPWTLTIEDVREITSKSCHYCGCQPSMTIGSEKHADGRFVMNEPYVYNGIDRVDSSVGYHVANCVPCCHTCNFMKGTMSVEFFYKHLNQINETAPHSTWLR
jgi:hypothetical protein